MEKFKKELEEILVDCDRKIYFINIDRHDTHEYPIYKIPFILSDGYIEIEVASCDLYYNDYDYEEEEQSCFIDVYCETYFIAIFTDEMRIYINKDQMTESKKSEIKDRLIKCMKKIDR